jgi:hypothetical protein
MDKFEATMQLLKFFNSKNSNNCTPKMPPSDTTKIGWQVVTNCSSIKRRTGPAITPVMGHQTLEKFSTAWVNKILKAKDLVTVEETYGGRTFTEALAATELLGAELYVISAGLGLVHAKDRIPNYNLTISQGSGSISNWLKDSGKSTDEWWANLNKKLGKPYPFFKIANESKGLILTLPSTYLEMISTELLMLPKAAIEKLIIITSAVGQKIIDPELQTRCIPYDDRLDGVPAYRGTRNDFPQRALKHLVNEIDFQKKPIEEIKQDVLNFLSVFSKPTLPTRTKLDDEQIKELISQNWAIYLGKRESLHRFLRDVALVACEQKRFGALWNQVKLENS